MRYQMPVARYQIETKISFLILFFSGIWLLVSGISTVHAQVAIETSVSRSRVPLGEELTLDIIISNADGKILLPKISSIEGFTSYSQGHSQEISILNGRTTSRSVFSYVLVANSLGEKTIGPFEVTIGGKDYTVAPVKVQVVPDAYSQAAGVQNPFSQVAGIPAQAPPSRALPTGQVPDRDIFVKVWLDKDEVYLNEPVMLTYTLYTRLSATYKGFEKEPVTTGFWVEDFPPDKTIKKTEQVLNGTRYVVADVRKLALFPTQAGVYNIDPGVLSASVEVRDQGDFDSFFSHNVFGSRRFGFSSPFSQVIAKTLVANPVTLAVKTLPENGKPGSFNGAVGHYKIESSMDKNDVPAGDPVTFRVRIWGGGNINTLQTPVLAKMDDFKVYDSSSSVNLKKERLVVTGEKMTETVIVAKRPGTYAIPPLPFSYFDPETRSYVELKTQAHTLRVSAAPNEEAPPPGTAVEPVAKEEVTPLTKDIRYIKLSNRGRPLSDLPFYKKKIYWASNGVLLALWFLALVFAGRRESDSSDFKGFRLRRSHALAKRKLRTASRKLKSKQSDEFYAEISKAVYGYFADKLSIPEQKVSLEAIEEIAGQALDPELYNKIRALLDELARGRFARVESGEEEMNEVYQSADRVITLFEKVKRR